MCVDDSIYSEIPERYFPDSNRYERVAPNYELVPRGGWSVTFPTLRGLLFRAHGGSLPPPNLTYEQTQCMASADTGRVATRFRQYYPQFKGWECCLDVIKKFEQVRKHKYSFVIKTRPDIAFAAPLYTTRTKAGASFGPEDGARCALLSFKPDVRLDDDGFAPSRRGAFHSLQLAATLRYFNSRWAAVLWRGD